MKRNKMVKNVFLLMAITMLSKFIGFFRELVMGYFYGASMHSDAFFTAYDIPQALFSLIASTIATTFIPLYCKVKEDRGKDGAIDFTNNIIGITLILGIIISFVVFIFMEQIVRVFAIGFKGRLFEETVFFARIILLGYIFTGLKSIMSAYLQANEEFFIPGIVGIPFNFIIICGIFMSSIFNNIYILPIGASIALFSQFVVQLPKALKLGYKPKLKIDFSDKYIREVFILAIPILLSVAVTQVNKVVDKTLASTLVVGSLSSLNYSNKLVGFFIGIFISTISIVMYPKLAELSSKKDKTEFNNLIRISINVVLLLIVPITFGCIVLSRPIVETLFMRGAFDTKAVTLTSNALLFYSIGMIGLAIRTVVTKIYYSIGDTKTPMLNSTLAVMINIVMSILLVGPLKNGGIALATSMSYLISSFMLMVNLKRKIGDYGANSVILVILKVAMASSIMAVIVRLSYSFFDRVINLSKIDGLLSLSGSIIIGVSLYIVIIKLLRVSEIEVMISEIKNRRKKAGN